MTVCLGIDVGTSSVKSVLVEGETIRAEAEFALATTRPRMGWTEQDPAAWWRGVTATLGKIRRKAARAYGGIGAIGLSGQMHGTVLLDAAHRPLRPSILWDDSRATAEAAALNQSIDDIAAVAGIIAMPGFTAPKLLWLARHEPELMKRLTCVLQAKDFIRLKLTGERATDMSDASGMMLLDVGGRRWSEPMVGRCGLSADQLPALHEGNAATGTVSRSMASRLGLPPAVIVAAGGGDAAASAVGLGAIAEGRSFISLGTSGQYFVARERFQPRLGRLVHSFAHCVAARWFDMAALLNGAAPFAWLARLLGIDVGAMLDLAPSRPDRREAPLFLPYLSGERTPHNDPALRGSLLGLGHETDAAALVRGVVEGVALSFADIAGDIGAAEDPGVVGGAARNVVMMQALADALGRPVSTHKGGSIAAAVGAARLARMALLGEAPEAVARRPAVEDRFRPRRSEAERYVGRLEAFRRAHAALRSIR
ncbi:MAG TPA: xylulokinase [Aestuariivirgaceae bacterium]|nr:xylulokinase [Aestuariivirgaceae bacterium]